MATERADRFVQRLIFQRNAARGNVTKEIEKLKALTHSNSLDHEAVRLQLSTAQYFVDQLATIDTQLLDALLDTDQDMQAEIDSSAQFLQGFIEVLKFAEITLNSMKCQSDSDRQSDGINSHATLQGPIIRAKLPRLELPDFSGDPIQWQSFWDSFESKVDSDDSVSDIDKLHYLLKLLKGGGLQCSKSDASKLKEIYSECEKHIRCLVALGLPEDTFGQVFVPLILSKLPRATRLQLHRSQGQKEWNLQDLRNLMKQEIVARDLSDRFSKNFGISDQPEKGKQSNHSSHNQNQKTGKSKTWVTQGALVNHSKTQVKCSFCGNSHYSDACSKYATAETRKSVLTNQCYNCLGEGHRSNECTRTKLCYYCKGHNHHSSLCYKQFGTKGSNTGKQSRKDDSSSTKFNSQKLDRGQTALSANSKEVLSRQTVLKMSTVYFPHAQREARIYFDDGSSASYITNQLAKDLGLKLSSPQHVSVGRFGSNKRQSQRFHIADLPIPLKNGDTFRIPVHVIDVITSPVQKVPLDLKTFPMLSYLPLADSIITSTEMVEIDILLGGDYLHQLITGERISVNEGLYLYGSKLGYIPAGSVEAPLESGLETAGVVLFAQADPLSTVSAGSHFHIDRFWAIEDLEIKDNPHVDDNDLALDIFNDSIRMSNGRYEVGLPWRQNFDQLPNNYGLALARLTSLHKRLKVQPNTLQEYDDTLQNQIQLGIIEDAPKGSFGSKSHYIPHHCVMKTGSNTTKLRIVYDASAKLNKCTPSLNDSLLRGPVMIQDLCGLLLRFRVGKIALICDIEKAFHQVAVRESDRDSLRFLWLNDPDGDVAERNLRVLRFCRVPFGIICSPFLLDQTIRHHLSQKNTEVSKQIQRNIYVDNIQSGHSTIAEAIQYFHQTKSIFSEISMNVREWFSNSTNLLDTVGKHDKGDGAKTKVLGLPWDTEKDLFSLSGIMQPMPSCSTKRQFLSTLSGLFDPLGWTSPVLITAKLLVQELWKVKLGWDQTIPNNLRGAIASSLGNIEKLSSISRPRFTNQQVWMPKTTHELHCFVDASAKVFAAVVYLRTTTYDGHVSVGLAMAKARFAPINSVTIPRLELMANVIGIRLIQFVERELCPDITVTRKFMWTDSKCVLYWLNSERKLKIFVANRISEIKKVPEVQFRYVPTLCNPADLPTKGCTAEQLLESQLWWTGPSFLALESEMWPETTIMKGPQGEADKEISKSVLSVALVVPSDPRLEIQTIINPDGFSQWRRLTRVTAVVLLAVEKFKARSSRSHTDSPLKPPSLFGITPDLLARAETLWIRFLQARLSDDMASSRRCGNLVIFTDNEGLIRCRGRMQYSDLSQSAKYPILLPKLEHHIIRLIVEAYHTKLGHAGVRQTLAHLREKFWLSQGRRTVSKIVRRCPVCVKVQGGHFKLPDFPPLPEFRITQSQPFERVGIDYFGPLLVKNSANPEEFQKCWVALFACCVTRAVYLDMVLELSTEQFMLCFRRFVASYGSPKLVITDNAKQFKSADQFFHKVITNWASSVPFNWKFIPEFAPWMGGFYERLVGTVKSALKKSLGSKRLSPEQLQTLLFEIAAIVNSRPLVTDESEFEPGELALTPAHFLAKNGRCGIPPIITDENHELQASTTAESLLRTWKTGQRILDEYWRCWRNEYLASVRERTKTQFSQRNCSHIAPKIGELVQIKDNLPRCKWRLGIIADLHTSGDGNCRSAMLRLPGGRTITRPLRLLFPLEISTPENQDTTPCQINNTKPPLQSESFTDSDLGNTTQSLPSDPTTACSISRPKRKAAIHSRDRTAAELLLLESDDE